jgi:hypothetical protein
MGFGAVRWRLSAKSGRPISPMNRLISLSTLSRLACLLVAAILCSCRDTSIPPRIERTAIGVEGFDLVFDDSAAKAEFGLFELGYAIKANYRYFTYRGKLFRSVGGGSVVILPITSSPAGFAVRETVQATDKRGYVSASLLQILDKRNGQELARRGLVAHAVEDGTGWTGDHAVKFVRKVLSSPQAPGQPWGGSDYRPARAKVDLTKSRESSPYPSQVTPKHCPETLRIERRPHSSTVTGEGFEFLPRHPLKLVACDAGFVLVTSGIYASDLYFDVLTLNGEHTAQGYVRLPLPMAARWAKLEAVRLDGQGFKMMLLANEQSDLKSAVSAHALVNVQVAQK